MIELTKKEIDKKVGTLYFKDSNFSKKDCIKFNDHIKSFNSFVIGIEVDKEVSVVKCNDKDNLIQLGIIISNLVVENTNESIDDLKNDFMFYYDHLKP